jgi:polysaccharide biosynthesis transport protein
MSTEPEAYEGRPGRDPLEYLEIPLRYPKSFFVPIVVIMAVAVALAFLAPRKYRSSTLVIVESKTVPSDYYVSAASAEIMNQRLNTIRQVALSRTRMDEIIKKLDPYPDMAGEPLHVVQDRMKEAIQIRVHGTDSFMFEYVNRYPYKAMVVTNMLASQFIEDTDRLRDQLNHKALELLQANVAQARTALAEREQAIGRFERANRDVLPDHQEANLRMLTQLQLEQQTLGETLRTLEGRREALERGLRDGPRAGGGSTPPETELGKLLSTYEALKGRYTEEHPEMLTIRARAEYLREQIAARRPERQAQLQGLEEAAATKVSQALQQVEGEIVSLKDRREELDGRIAVFQKRVEAAPTVAGGLADLHRDYPQIRQDYDLAVRREKDAEMARRLEEFWRTGYFRVLDPAYLPGRPILPYSTLFLLGGLVVGLAAGLAVALVADVLDRSVKSERELQEILPYPLLVTMPRAPNGGARGRRAAEA